MEEILNNAMDITLPCNAPVREIIVIPKAMFSKGDKIILAGFGIAFLILAGTVIYHAIEDDKEIGKKSD